MWTYQGKEEEDGQTQGGKMCVRTMGERYDRGGAERGEHNKTGKHGGIRSSAIPASRRPQMTGQARDEEDNTTNRAVWRNKIISYTGDPR